MFCEKLYVQFQNYREHFVRAKCVKIIIFYTEVVNHFVQDYKLCNPYICAPCKHEKIPAAQLHTCTTTRYIVLCQHFSFLK